MFLQVAPAPAVSSIQQIREARLQPLKIALQDAIALHTKATGVREALEVEVSGNSNVRLVQVQQSAVAHWVHAASLQGQVGRCAVTDVLQSISKCNAVQRPSIQQHLHPSACSWQHPEMQQGHQT
jgi:hypothetical protein